MIALFGLACLPILLLFADKHYGRIHQHDRDSEQLHAEPGDIIFRSNSYFLSAGEYFYKSGIPGHLAIVLSDNTFPASDPWLGNIDVAESAMLNKYRMKFQADVSVNKAFENFSGIRGKRFLLKMHLNEQQKKKLIELVNQQLGKPYRIFASKNSQTTFNCATFVRWINLELTGFDLDSDGGRVVFPDDILSSPRFRQPGDRIRF